MPAMEPLCHLIGIKAKNLLTDEKILLEADLFARIVEKLKELFKRQYQSFFNLMKFTHREEDAMLEKNFTRFVLNDILSTEEYTIQGIASYMDTHEDIIQELAAGLNTKPLASCLRKVIELHRSVRRELYLTIGKKIADEILMTVSTPEKLVEV